MSGAASQALLAGVLVAVAALLGPPWRVAPRGPAPPGDGSGTAGLGTAGLATSGPGARTRQAGVSVLAGVGVQLFLGGTPGAVAGAVAALGCWRVLGSAEPAVVRRARARAARDLPHLVGLMAAGLRAGAPPGHALAAACAALPGEAADALAPTTARLALGVDPVTVWSDLAGSGAGDAPTTEPGVAVLGRTLARSHQTGASVRETVEALADQLAERERAGAEDRARAVGVRAALPLGLCLLPAFLLLGVVPVVAGLAAQLGVR
ncbi:type II secretion system F family protein [Nocardioides solisilvae]|uniref:type II secretion system F family protein n=1 Tax=Nocardioides solisilvae TaxID=1542435 RepID=UPI000D74F576|nr:type II secretion system F family protein [Nocardioides solisilvae]